MAFILLSGRVTDLKRETMNVKLLFVYERMKLRFDFQKSLFR